MLPRLALLAAIAAAAVPAAAAPCMAEGGERVTPVVELYTSEGCSSCPPADRWLSSRFPAGGRRDAIALAFHVDYWDGLGWKDRFASPAASERQAQAARANRATFVYTPQVLLQGRDFTGWRRGDVAHALAIAASRPAAAALALEATADALGVSSTARVTLAKAGAQLVVALVDSGHASEVKAGENAGARLAHDHVVRTFAVRPLGQGASSVQLTLPRPAARGTHAALVALVQDRQRGDVLQSVYLPLEGCER